MLWVLGFWGFGVCQSLLSLLALCCRYPEASTVFWSGLLAFMLYTTIIRFVVRVRNWALVTGDEAAAQSVILPSYLPVLYAGVVEVILRGSILLVFGTLCDSTYIDQFPENASLNPLNSVLYAMYVFSFELFVNSIGYFFFQRSVSHNAFMKSLAYGALLSSIVTLFPVVGINYQVVSIKILGLFRACFDVWLAVQFGSDSSITFRRFRNALDIVYWCLPLIVLWIPLYTSRTRRASSTPFILYSIGWRTCFILAYTYEWITWEYTTKQHSSRGNVPNLVIVVLMFIRDTLLPVFLYLTLVSDTHYWRGLPRRKYLNKMENSIRKRRNRSSLESTSEMLEANIREPLVGLERPRYPPGDTANDQLQRMLDNVPKQKYIDFAFLHVNYGALIGRGATASVFAGTLIMSRRQLKKVSITSEESYGDQNSVNYQTDSSSPVRQTSSEIVVNASTWIHNYLERSMVSASMSSRMSEDGSLYDTEISGTHEQSSTVNTERGGFGSGLYRRGKKVVKVPVAVKIYTPPELNVSTVEAFAKETEILGELSHPNIVHYYGLCVNPPHLCLVFALLPGGTLQVRCFFLSFCEQNALCNVLAFRILLSSNHS